MALSEIEKLERRYAENPQGLTFAPLAEVHRKNGEVQRALDLLRPGLAIHPDYIPASIVLGRCHLDLGDVHAAEKAFVHVLALDGENVIALKALADISERLLKFDDAERWLNTLLAVDRSNDDAREQLQRVEVSRRQAEVGSSAQPSSVAEEQAIPEAAEAVTADAPPPPPPPPFDTPVAEPARGWVSQSAAQVSEPSPIEPEGLVEPSPLRERLEEPAGIQFEDPAGIQIDEPVRLEDSVEPIDGLVGREVDTPDQRLDAFRLETSEDIILRSAGGSEFQMPDASQELFSSPPGDRPSYAQRGPFEEDAPLASNAAADAPPLEPKLDLEPQLDLEPKLDAGPEPPPRSLVEPELVAVEQAVPEAWPIEPSQPAPTAPSEPVPTTAGAEVRLEQRAGEDYRWRRKTAGLQEERSAPPPPSRSYTVGDTGGRSVAQLFQGILSARPPAQTSAATVQQASPGGNAGAPTRPAADALSLSSVFGDEASDTPPAVPASSPGSGSVSFDDFFGSQSGSPASRAPRAPDPKNDDLDQFHAWLQNLKR